MKSLTRDELDRVLSAAGAVSAIDALMLRVTFNHGLRASETVNLTRDNIVDGHLIVQRLKGSRKTAHPLLADEKAALEALAASTTGRLFPIHRMTFWRKMQAYCLAANVPAFKAHPHALKHSTGRLGYQGGMGIPEIQSYLGHVSGSSTMIYLQADEAQAASAFAAAVGK